MSSPLPGGQSPQSILTLAHTLHSSLIEAFAPPLPADSRAPTTHLLHPLSAIPPSTLARSQAQITATFAALRSSCGAFSSALLDPSSAHAAPRPATEKLLSLLKETASSQAVLLSHRQDAKRAADALRTRRPPLPVLSAGLLQGTPADRTLAILDAVSNSLGLSTFRDTAVDALTTLSVGGKCMVVDLDVDASTGRVLRTKLSYVIGDNTIEDEAIAGVLGAALANVERVNDVEWEAEVETGLGRFKDALEELKRLDEMTVETGVDSFAVAAKMASSVLAVLALESGDATTLDPAAHGLASLDTANPHAAIVFHASAAAQLDPGWASAVLSREFLSVVANRPSEICTVRLRLEKPASGLLDEYLDPLPSTSLSPSPLDPSFPLLPSPPNFRPTSPATHPTFVAHFSPAVPITRETGRRIMDVAHGALFAPDEGNAASVLGPGPGVGVRPPGWAETTWIEDLLTSKTSPALTRFSPADSYIVKFPDVALAHAYTLASPGTLAGFLCEHVRVQSPAQLFRVVEILKEQLLVNDLVRSVLAAEHRVAPKPSPTRSPKKRRVDVLNLDELFDESTRTTLPISLTLAPSSPPSLTVTFPASHTSLAASFPITIIIRSTPLEVQFQFGTDDPDELEWLNERLDHAKAENVIGVARDLGLLMRWVGRRLEGGKKGMEVE